MLQRVLFLIANCLTPSNVVNGVKTHNIYSRGPLAKANGNKFEINRNPPYLRLRTPKLQLIIWYKIMLKGIYP